MSNLVQSLEVPLWQLNGAPMVSSIHLTTVIYMESLGRRLRYRHQCLRLVGLVTAGILLPLGATAQDSASSSGDVMSGQIDYLQAIDSNLFRRPSFASPQSDVISTTTGALSIDKSFSQQRVQLQLTDTLNRYQNSSYLNFDATASKATWHWDSSVWMHASASIARATSLALFSDTLNSQRNITVREDQTLNFDGRLMGGWSWLTAISDSDQKSQQAIVNQPDQRTNSEQVGVKYTTQAGSSVSAIRRFSSGNYLNQSAIVGATGSGFREENSEINLSWVLSEKSLLTGRVDRVVRKDAQIDMRDYSSFGGDCGYVWKTTGKLSLNVIASRSIAPLQDPSFSYTVTNNVSVTPIWQIASKVALHAMYSRGNYLYNGRGPVPESGVARKDLTDHSEIGIDWNPYSKFWIKASVQQERRSSNTALAEYADRMAKINALWAF